MTKALTVVGCLLLAACVGPFRRAGDPCDTAETTLGVRQCLDGQVRGLEAQLAVALDSAKVRGPSGASVDSAQTAWRVYRQLQCEAEAREFEGGTLAPVTTLYCWRALTKSRLAEVREMYRVGGK